MVGIRLSPEERKDVEEAAREEGMPMGKWLRVVAVEAARDRRRPQPKAATA